MTEGTELAIETVTAGVLFCMAITMLLLLFTVCSKQWKVQEAMPEHIIMFEEAGDGEWKHLEESLQ